jgi:hypothetical protein
MNRVWAFIISNPLSDTELEELLKAGQTFVAHWTAHEHQLTATFGIFKKRIIIVKVNEDIHGASGCSIDKLTRFIKVSETMFGIELLNRLLVAYGANGEIEVVHSGKIKELLDKNIISEDTVIFNTSVASEKDLQNWEQPLKTTWLNKYLQKV